MFVIGRVFHLPPGDLAARGEVFGRLAAATLLALLQLVLRWRDNEDGDRVRHEPAHLLRALDVDLEHDVVALAACALDPIAERAVQVAVVVGVLEESALGDQTLELLASQEGVVLIRLLAGSRLTRRPRYRVDQVRIELEKALDQCVLAHPGRARDHDQQAAFHDAKAQKA